MSRATEREDEIARKATEAGLVLMRQSSSWGYQLRDSRYGMALVAEPPSLVVAEVLVNTPRHEWAGALKAMGVLYV